MTEQVLINFRHGMGDCANLAMLAALYRRHGFDIRVCGEDNKRFIWQAAGLDSNVRHEDATDHAWPHPAVFWNLRDADHEANKTAGNINADPLPTINSSRSELWRELCGIDLDATPHIGDQIHAEADRFLESLPDGPIVALHACGTNSQEAKRIDAQTQIDLQRMLVEAGCNVIVLDYDSRAVQVGHERIRGIKPGWGHISIDRLAALLSRCGLLIGVDSGPLHFARAFCRVPLLGVYFDRGCLLPHRVAIPSPRLTSLVPSALRDIWRERTAQGVGWQFADYQSDEPTATEIFAAAMARIDRSPKQFISPQSLATIIGQYTYRRIGHDQRPVELRADGTIDHGEVAGNNERRWRLLHDGSLEIRGDAGVIAVCRRDGDRVWRGRWNKYERMPVEFVPADRPAPPVRTVSHHSSSNGTVYFPTSSLLADAVALSRKLPPLRAVAGVPRSGLIPASAIALELNVPLVPLESLYRGEQPPTSVRRRQRIAEAGDILVVDETSATGLQLSQLRERLPHVKTAVVYCDQRSVDVVDYYHATRGTEICIQEWTLFHDDNNEYLVTDMDGVLCEDWTGGDEEQHEAAYLDFLHHAKPRRIPTTETWPLMAIVTGRMEKHRKATEEWLARHGIRYSALIMSPHSTARERDQADTASMKAREYALRPGARVFVESCRKQSLRIKELTGRPVLCIETNSLV